VQELCVCAPLPGMRKLPGSKIRSEMPDEIPELCVLRLQLLWQGSRDGFGADVFHERCDGQANTVVLIQDTNGNIFGGLTPIAWESSAKGKDKADPSLESFLFHIRNPQGDKPQLFQINSSKMQYALWCSTTCGPCLLDLFVADRCNENSKSTLSGFDFKANADVDEPRKHFLHRRGDFQGEGDRSFRDNRLKSFNWAEIKQRLS
jgi:hypothetical protein